MQEQNNAQCVRQERSLSDLALTVQNSYAGLGDVFTASSHRIEGLNQDVAEYVDNVHNSLPHLSEDAFIRRQLAALRQRAEHGKLENYVNTGETPARRGLSHSATINHQAPMEPIHMRPTVDRSPPPRHSSPCKIPVFTDCLGHPRQETEKARAAGATELDTNTAAKVLTEKGNMTSMKDMVELKKDKVVSTTLTAPRSLKRPATNRASTADAIPSKKRRSRTHTDHEDTAMLDLGLSMGHSPTSSSGRTLRSHSRADRVG